MQHDRLSAAGDLDRPVGGAGLADGKFVTGLELSALEAAERAKGIGGARAQDQRHVDAASDRNIAARALLEKIEGELLAALHLEARPGLARLAIELRRQL